MQQQCNPAHVSVQRKILYVFCSTLRRRIKGAASTINAIIRQPCYIFPVVGSYSTVASTVFARSLSGQLEDLVSQRSDCLWLERVARRSGKTCYKSVKASFTLVYIVRKLYIERGCGREADKAR